MCLLPVIILVYSNLYVLNEDECLLGMGVCVCGCELVWGFRAKRTRCAIVQVILFTLQIIYRFAICFVHVCNSMCACVRVYVMYKFSMNLEYAQIHTNIDEFRLFVCLLAFLFVCVHACMNAYTYFARTHSHLVARSFVHFNCVRKIFAILLIPRSW